MTDQAEPSRVFVSPSAADRIAFASRTLSELPASATVLVIGPSLEASSHVARAAAIDRPATYGTVRTTFALYVGSLARPVLAKRGLVVASSLTLEAVAARLARDAQDALGPFHKVAKTPGFSRALARTLAELRLAKIAPDDSQMALQAAGESLGKLAAGYAKALADLGLADPRAVLDAAVEALATAPREDLVVLVDVRITTRAEEDFLAALGRARTVAMTIPSGDVPTLAAARRALGSLGNEAKPAAAGRPLDALKWRLLSDSIAEDENPTAPELAGVVRMRSAPGESRECVEIARTLTARAREGVAFDRMAILLRSPEVYVPHLVEALRRAGLPAHFARGLKMPDPSGRALLALLDCAAEGLSAKRFAEYLSLGELPKRTANAPPPPRPGTFTPTDDDAATAALERLDDGETEAPAEPEDAELGTLRAPFRWERLLVEASVIGGLDRWSRRLDGLRAELRQKHALYTEEEDPRAEHVERDIQAIAELRAFAIPLLVDLDALRAGATWRTWLARLSSLATRALRRPERVLAVLSELWPLDAETSVSLSEVRAVLEPRLADVRDATRGRRLGKVFVGAIDDARGLSFDTVFVPGLVEKAFPKKVLEDPLFLDHQRRSTSPLLATNGERSNDERLMLRLATGAAENLVVFSYPRVDADAGRPRTPSFYGLEVLRVVEGRLPTYESLKRLADTSSRARLGWPAPDSREDAIDDAEHDLAVLAALLGEDEAKNVGAARFLLGENPHLRRSLYARAYRWRKGKYVAQDGLVDVPPGSSARVALDTQGLSQRSFSPTALQHFSACPYRFYLSALLKLAKREEPSPLEELDPLQRGTLVHETQFELLTRLRKEGMLPVREANLTRAQDLLEETLGAVAGRHEDTLFPAIPRVWEDGLAHVRADLREWLRRMVDDHEWTPTHFELSFGLTEHDEGRDAASQKEPVVLESGLRLRGSIDLVETRISDGALRATDHKTGKVYAEQGSVVSGGKILQPVLYALAVEKVLAGHLVTGGRLYYCTSTGDYTPVDVPLDGVARDAVTTVVAAVGDALTNGMLPAAPIDDKACRYCDYRDVCGPYEPVRIKQKRDPRALPLLKALRELP